MRADSRVLTVSSALVALVAAGAHASSRPLTSHLPFAPTGLHGRLDVTGAGRTVVFDTSSGGYAVDGVWRNARPVAVSLPAADGTPRQPMWAFDFTSIRLGAGTTVTVRGARPLLLLSRGPADIAAPLRLDGARGGRGGVGAGGGGGGGGGSVAVFAGDTLTVTGAVSVRGGAGGVGNTGARATAHRAYDGGPGGGGTVVLGSATRVVLDAPLVTLSGDGLAAGPVTVVGDDVRYGTRATVNALDPDTADVVRLPRLPREQLLVAGGSGGGGGGGSGLPPEGPAGYARAGSPGGSAGPGGGDGGASGYAMAGGSGGTGGDAAPSSDAGGGGGGGGGAYQSRVGGGGGGSGSGSGANGVPGAPGGAQKCRKSASGGGGGSGGVAATGNNGGHGGAGGDAPSGGAGAPGGNGVNGGGGGGGGGGGDACGGNAPGVGGGGGAGSNGSRPGGHGNHGRNAVPRGRKCSSAATFRVASAPGDHDMTGVMDAGPLNWHHPFTVHCVIQVRNDVHSAIDATATVHATSVTAEPDEHVAVLPATLIDFTLPEDTRAYVCTSISYGSAGETIYWQSGNDGPDLIPGTDDDVPDEWSSDPGSTCSAVRLSTAPVLNAINAIIANGEALPACAALSGMHWTRDETHGGPVPGDVVYVDHEGDVFLDDGGGITEARWRETLWWDCPAYVDVQTQPWGRGDDGLPPGDPVIDP